MASTYSGIRAHHMKPSVAALPFLLIFSVGCASTSGPSSWAWPWKTAAAPTPTPTAPTGPTSPFAQQALTAPASEWPDEKKAASDIKLAMAQMLEKQGAVDDATTAYEKLLQDSPNNAAIAHRLAVLLDKKGLPEQAESHYTHALRIDPKNAHLLADYGYHCYLQRRWSDAEANLMRSLQLDSNQARVHSNLALVLARTQRIEPALKEFSLAGCSPADAHANVAFTLAAEAQLEQAEHHYRTALSLDPSHKRSQEALAALGVARAKAQPGQQPVMRASAEQPAGPPIPTSRRMGGPMEAPHAQTPDYYR